jgi:hypothetical protein
MKENVRKDVRCPCSSTLAKQLSVMRRRSSSKRSARDMPEVAVMELADDAGPPGAPGGRRDSLLGLLLPPDGPLRDRGFPSIVVP